MTLMRATEYAKHRGVTKGAVSNWKSAGLLVWADDPERPGRQLIDVQKSDAYLDRVIDPTRGRPRAGEVEEAQGDGSAAPARAAISKIEAARLEDMAERTLRRRLDNQVILGSLVPLAEYERRAGDMGRLVRERTSGIIRQLAERLAAETEPRQIIALLSEQFDQLFDHLADQIEADAKAEAGVDQVLAAEADDEEDDAEDL